MYDYGYGYNSYDYSSAANAVGVFAGVGLFLWIIGIAISVFSIISMWKLFTKAGKPGWASIVPIYNFIVMIEIAGLPMWYIALFLVPFANIYAMFKIYIEVAHKFGKSTGFGVGMVFLNIIFIPMLAFGKAEYMGGTTVSSVNVNNATNTQNNNMQVNQPIMNSNIPNMNNQPDIMNVNNNVVNSAITDVNVQNNNNAFQPIGDISNNINEVTSVNSFVQPATSDVQEVNSLSNNMLDPVNSNVVNPVNVETTPVSPVIPDTLGDTVASMNNVVEPVNDNIVNPVNINSGVNNMKKTCPNCGNQVEFSALFCSNCGNNL